MDKFDGERGRMDDLVGQAKTFVFHMRAGHASQRSTNVHA